MAVSLAPLEGRQPRKSLERQLQEVLTAMADSIKAVPIEDIEALFENADENADENT